MFFLKKNKLIPLVDFFPVDFTDIHSHLLPGIDDGSKDLSDSIALIEKMYSYGIKNFVTTPHVLGTVYPNTKEIILDKCDLVKSTLIKKGFFDINFRASAEYMLDEYFVKILESDEIIPLKDNLILVEMSYFNPPFNLFDILFEIQNKGYKPILAHPERYVFYHNDINNYYRLKKAGCLFQMNLLSLTRQYGKGVQKMTTRLLKENIYDFVGTDTHHLNHLKLLQSIATNQIRKNINQLLLNNIKFK